jgi:hypothetical protein
MGGIGGFPRQANGGNANRACLCPSAGLERPAPAAPPAEGWNRPAHASFAAHRQSVATVWPQYPGGAAMIEFIQRNSESSKTGTGMTLKEIDEALAAWNLRLTAMADNLMSLQSESAYQMLTGSGGATRLQVEGETAQRTRQPLAAIRTIFEQFDILHSTIDRATKIRAGLPSLFGGDEKILEIAQLLFGRSIELPAASVSFDQRTLLSGAPSAQRLTPEELLSRMARTFADARDAVLAVDRAWQQIADRLVRAEAQIAQFAARFAASGCGPSAAAASALKAAQDLTAELSETLKTDPLGASARLTSQLEPAIARLSGLVEAAERVSRELLIARADFERLTTLHAEAEAAAAEARLKIANLKTLPAPVSPEKLRRLQDWLDQLERRWAEGAQETVASALRNWQQTANIGAQEDTSARDASRSAVAARRELRGRLEALKAKARAMGIAEHAPVAAIATEAESLLATRPTDMEAASAAVAAYGKTLHQATREA